MAFRLVDDPDTSSQVGSAVTRTVPVTDGLFAAVLNEGGEFGPTAFTGEGRWLGIRVACPGDGGYADLGPPRTACVAPVIIAAAMVLLSVSIIPV